MIQTVSVPERLLHYFSLKHGLTREQSEARFDELVEYLDLCAESSEPITPSRRVDETWHCMILHTKQYADFCQRRYGKFIHHNPFPPSQTTISEQMPSGQQLVGECCSSTCKFSPKAGCRGIGECNDDE